MQEGIIIPLIIESGTVQEMVITLSI